MSERDQNRLESNLILKMENAHNSDRVMSIVIYIVSSLPIPFQAVLLEMGLKIVCCRTMREACVATGDPALANVEELCDAVFSPSSKTLYVAENPDDDEPGESTPFEFLLELMKAFAILSGLDTDLLKDTVARDLLNHPQTSGSAPDPIRTFSFCLMAFLDRTTPDEDLLPRCKRNYPETMQLIQENFSEFEFFLGPGSLSR